MGINAKLHMKNFKNVITCESNHAYYMQAKDRIEAIWGNHKPNIHKNINIINEDSKKLLHELDYGQYIFYLDAHFYNPSAKPEDRFVVLNELRNMRKFKDSIIIIHDFDNGLGHITYDGINLNLKLLKPELDKINKKFFFYTNTLEGCDIVKPNAKDIVEAGLTVDYETLDNLDYAWTAPRLTYRGILYCLPTKLTRSELNELGLREWN